MSVIKLQFVFLAASPNFTIALPWVSLDFTYLLHATSPNLSVSVRAENFTTLQVTLITSTYSPLILLERMRKLGSYVCDRPPAAPVPPCWLHLLGLHAEGLSCNGAGPWRHGLGVVRCVLSDQLRHAGEAGEVVAGQRVLLLHLVDEHVAVALPQNTQAKVIHCHFCMSFGLTSVSQARVRTFVNDW